MNTENFDTNKSHELSDSDLENVSGGSKGPVDGEYQVGDDGSDPDAPINEDGTTVDDKRETPKDAK